MLFTPRDAFITFDADERAQSLRLIMPSRRHVYASARAPYAMIAAAALRSRLYSAAVVFATRIVAAAMMLPLCARCRCRFYGMLRDAAFYDEATSALSHA